MTLRQILIELLAMLVASFIALGAAHHFGLSWYSAVAVQCVTFVALLFLFIFIETQE